MKANIPTGAFVVRMQLQLLQLGLGLPARRSEESHHLFHDGPAVVETRHPELQGSVRRSKRPFPERKAKILTSDPADRSKNSKTKTPNKQMRNVGNSSFEFNSFFNYSATSLNLIKGL